MIVYSVNCGKYPSFKEASEARKSRLAGKGFIYAAGDCYTIKVHTALRKGEAMDVLSRLPPALEGWVEVRDTNALKEEKNG